MSNTEFVKSFDQTDLLERSWLPDQDPLGVVLVIHGNLSHSGHFLWVGEQLKAQGYAVFAYDMRGTGGSQSPDHLDDPLIQQHSQDLSFYIERLRSRFSDTPLFVMAESLGGSLCLVSHHTKTLPIDGLILVAPGIQLNLNWFGVNYSQSWLQMAKAGNALLEQCMKASPVDPFAWRVVFEDEYIQTDQNSFAHWQFIVEVMDKVEASLSAMQHPLLILHGREDAIVALEGSERLYERALSEDKTLLIYPSADHDCLHGDVQEEALKDVCGWLNDHS